MLATLKLTETPLNMDGWNFPSFPFGKPQFQGRIVSFTESNDLNLQKRHEALLERGFSRVSHMIFGLVHVSLSRGVLIKQKKWKVTLVEKLHERTCGWVIEMLCSYWQRGISILGSVLFRWWTAACNFKV